MKELILNVLRSELKTHLEDYNEYLIIRAMLIPYNGKNIRNGIELTPGYTVQYGGNDVTISTPRNRVHIVCKGLDCHMFNINMFDAQDAKYNSMAQSKAKQLQAIINKPGQLIQILTHLKKTSDEFRKQALMLRAHYSTYTNPAYDSLLTALELKPQIINSI